jgi:transposase
VITSVQRRRWSAEEKARIVQETYAPGMSVSLVARQRGVAPNQVFKWRQLYAEGALQRLFGQEDAHGEIVQRRHGARRERLFVAIVA